MSLDNPAAATPSAVDLRAPSATTFMPLRGEVFQELGEDDALSLTLVAVETLPGASGLGRAEPFALVFTGPRLPTRPQGLRTLLHPAVGRLDVFLVPIRPDAHGARYEAVFT